MGAPGNPTCNQCHIPHKAQGAYLWAQAPSTRLGGLGSLCFSCHDGSIAGQWIPDYASHPVDPGVKGEDCDRCHDAHAGDNWKFATDALAPDFRNANLCASCHDTGAFTHPNDVLATEPNLPVDRVWSPPTDFSGTRLFDATGAVVVPGGDAYIKCATCHSPHGGTGYAMNTMAPNDPDNSHSPICENCHQ